MTNKKPSHKQKVEFAEWEIDEYLEDKGRLVGLSRHLIRHYGQAAAAEALLKHEGDFTLLLSTWYYGVRPTTLFRAMDRLMAQRYAIPTETRLWVADRLIDKSTVRQLIPLTLKLTQHYEGRFDFLKSMVTVR